mmetsp:Transcript_98125/g.211657  ORF Transcript_98125/g.211657 Transcript_98125/m.211657 type:complete len:82 (+) Transcript_98125:302-547(+)
MGLTKYEREMQTLIREKFTQADKVGTSQQLVGQVYRGESELALFGNNQHPLQLWMYRKMNAELKALHEEKEKEQNTTEQKL